MKVLTKDGVVLFVCHDNEEMSLSSDNAIICESGQLTTVTDCNSANSKIYEGATVPSDFICQNYIYDGVKWEENPEWQTILSFVVRDITTQSGFPTNIT